MHEELSGPELQGDERNDPVFHLSIQFLFQLQY
jgi:hypothetical protein